MNSTLLFLLLALQAEAGPQSISAETSLHSWRESHGMSWQLEQGPLSSFPQMLFGGRVPSAMTPLSDGEWFDLGLERVVDAHPVLQVDASNLIPREVIFLPLGWIGSTDKLTVSFAQVFEGLPVEGARMNVLFDSMGGLLSLQTSCAAGELESAAFEFEEEAAGLRALKAFLSETDLNGVLASTPRRAWWPIAAGGVRPAWMVDVGWESPGVLPVGRSLVLDAGDGSVLSSQSTVHTFDITGSVRARITPGTEPDTSSNPEVWAPAPYVKLTGSFGEVISDENGDFVLPGVNGSTSVTAVFEGPFARVQNESGSDYSTSTSVSNGGQVSMNSGTAQYDTAQSNAFVEIARLRDWIRAVNPSDSHADFAATANCNINSSCNAYFNGGSVNFYRQAGNCVNTSYSTVIAHEMGHWLNVRYGTGNGMDGMGEGNADVFAMYLYDDPIVGEDFCGNNCNIRSGTNTSQFCGDWNPSCYGQVHADGKPWMGAAWKVRTHLNNAYGNSTGDLIADSLFMGWMNSFNQDEIRSVIETQWVLLDDDDGDILNGSPHFDQIDAGFRQQGFPGLETVPISAEIVQAVADTEHEYGPYTVRARLKQHFGHPLAGAALFWRTNGGSWHSVPMTDQTDDFFVASVPDQPSPNIIQYYVEVSDSLGNTAREPAGAPQDVRSFAIGRYVPAFVANFDNILSDEGWSHGSYGDTSNGADDWERTAPAGAGGTELGGGVNGVYWSDPSQAVSGDFSWGNDLGVIGDGQYPNSAHMWLRSPQIDASSWLGCRLQFQRQLSVARLDEARLRVEGTTLYESGDLDDTSDLDWTPVEYDISSFADGNSALDLEWELESDGGVRLGGWNIDSVRVMRLVAASAGDCLEPRAYGPGKIHSGGAVAELFHSGEAQVGAEFIVKIRFAVPNTPSLLFSGVNGIQVPFLGGYRLVGGDIQRHGANILSPAGAAGFDLDVTPSLGGTTRFYQVWFRDPSHLDGTGVGLSPGLRVDYCP